jgi:hypothetical protein
MAALHTRDQLQIHTCPSCAADGGYGIAVTGNNYRCSECRVIWSPDPTGKTATTRIENWWQRVKVWWARR